MDRQHPEQGARRAAAGPARARDRELAVPPPRERVARDAARPPVPVVWTGEAGPHARSVRPPRVHDVLGRRQLRGLPDLQPASALLRTTGAAAPGCRRAGARGVSLGGCGARAVRLPAAVRRDRRSAQAAVPAVRCGAGPARARGSARVAQHPARHRLRHVPEARARRAHARAHACGGSLGLTRRFPALPGRPRAGAEVRRARRR